MLFISFYTKNTGYEKEVKNLITSLEKFNLKHEVVGVNSKGNWLNNCHYKTTFIKQMLEKYKGQEDKIIWLDSDAIIRKQPILFETIKEDIGVHYLKKGKENILLSGTIFINNNNRTRELFNLWEQKCKQSPNRFAQRILHSFIDTTNVSIYKLPVEYVKIFDFGDKNIEPVIEHFQASRRFKNGIKKYSK